MAHDHYRAVKSITGKRPFLLSRCVGVPMFGKGWVGLLSVPDNLTLGGESKGGQITVHKTAAYQAQTSMLSVQPTGRTHLTP